MTPIPRTRAVAVPLTLAVLVTGTVFGAVALAQTPVPTIQLLNPSSHSTIVSDKTDIDESYHLVAWGANLPANPVVRFELDDGSTATPIGQGNPVGTDTFQFLWAIPNDIADGTYTLRVLLLSQGGTEIARDEQQISLNKSDELLDPAAETVEITYPNNGAAFGLYSQVNQPTQAVVNVTTSAGTREVTVFYSTTAPGTEPDWTACGTENAVDAGDGVRCALTGADAPSQVTAVAAMVNDTPAPLPPDAMFNDSGDAHRVQPYRQVPNALDLGPAQQRVDAVQGQLPCSQEITATVRDQNGRLVAGVNVDVHATGPNNSLAFDTSSGNNQPPDANHTTTEPAFDCNAEAQGGQQGTHTQTSGPAIKHIESTQGTDDNGGFVFVLRSDAPGSSQVTGWADGDNDDRLCSGEAADAASIGWSEAAPAPSRQSAELATCPAPTSTGSPSPTSPVLNPRSVSLESSRARLTYNRRHNLSGQVTPGEGAPPNCTAGVPVRLFADTSGGSERFTEVATTTTSTDGAYGFERRAIKSRRYQARVDESPACAAADSPVEPVVVKKKVSLTASDRSVRDGDRARFKVRFGPCEGHRGDVVKLQTKDGGRFVTVGQKKSNRRCLAVFSRRVGDTARWRAFAPRTDADHAAGKSDTVRVTVR